METHTITPTLQHICENAANAGRDIDLNGCDYGPHKRTNLHLGVQPYYHFLAGFARTLGCKKVLEIGTSYGGSMMAISRGCDADQAGLELVTVDKIDIAGQGLSGLRHITRIHGDSLLPATLGRVRAKVSPPIDLLYIDSKHSYEHVTGNIRSYGDEFRPRFLILDDIHLNAEMENVWREISAQFGDQAFDASELAQRPVGFGVVAY